MKNRRFVVFAGILAVLVGVAVWTQVTITPAPAQEVMKPKVTGKVTDKTLKEFSGTDFNVPGIKSVKFARLTLGPNAKVEPMTAEGYGDLCNATRGTITVNLDGGKKVTYKAGDIFIVPMGMKAPSVQAGPAGYDETYWRVTPAK
ncbi:MAG: hypothetical protein ACT4PY_17220 [Armatimonadota bacterium]